MFFFKYISFECNLSIIYQNMLQLTRENDKLSTRTTNMHKESKYIEMVYSKG